MTIPNIHNKVFYYGRRDLLICFLLVMSTLAVYWQVQHHDFVNFDDNFYVTENRHVRNGLTPESIVWAFNFSDKENYWHPLTWLSHMLDCTLFGLNPGLHHLINLILHTANCLLLFVVLKLMTGACWRSAFVAMLFALHPVNVDTVAWVAERKNVLSTLFWMLSLLTYVYYARQPNFFKYLLTLLCFALGLLTKPMLVTLPFLLLLLDYWPLGRIQSGPLGVDTNAKAEKSVSGYMKLPVSRLLFEKSFFLILAVIVIVLSTAVLQQQEKLITLESVPMKLRIANALVSYISYIGKMIWPQNLAVLYPYPAKMLPIWQVVGAGLVLILMFVMILRDIRKRPYLTVGWLWYVGTLVPVIGLVQNGVWPAMADRWAYVPLIGIFIMIAWGVPEITARWPHRKIGLAAGAIIYFALLAALACKQVSYWKNSITLFEHTLKATSNNYISHYNLGHALASEGRLDDAIDHYLEALRIKPDCVEARNNLSLALSKQGRLDEAIDHYLEALRIKPDFEKAHYNLGLVFSKQGQADKAVYHYLEALRIKPDYKQAHVNLGVALERQGRIQDAVDHYLEALRIEPEEGTYNNLGNALEKQGRINTAIYHYLQALRINPDYVDAHYNLGIALDKIGRIDKAVHHYSEALRIKPDFAEAHNNLGIVLEKKGRLDEAIVHYLQALRIKPDFDEAHNNLGIALFLKGDAEGAVDHFREALRIKPDHVSANMNLKTILMKPRQDK